MREADGVQYCAGTNSRPAGPFHGRGGSDARRSLHGPCRRLWLSLGSFVVESKDNMNTPIRMGVITAALLVALLAFATEEVKGREALSKELLTVLAAEKTAAQLGGPIRISLSVKSQAEQEVTIDGSATAFDCFDVTDPDGQPASYVGFMGQIMFKPVPVQPSSTVTIAEGLDLTDKYIFQKAGRYSIRFKGERTGVPGSNTVTVDVTPGQLTELDQLVLRLLPVRPKDWQLTKSGRDQQEVAPFGRSRVAGYAATICRNYMSGEALYVWWTKAEAQIDPDQKPRIKSEYLARTGGLHVYVAEDSKTPALWPKAIEDISRVLQIVKE